MGPKIGFKCPSKSGCDQFMSYRARFSDKLSLAPSKQIWEPSYSTSIPLESLELPSRRWISRFQVIICWLMMFFFLHVPLAFSLVTQGNVNEEPKSIQGQCTNNVVQRTGKVQELPRPKHQTKNSTWKVCKNPPGQDSVANAKKQINQQKANRKQQPTNKPNQPNSRRP